VKDRGLDYIGTRSKVEDKNYIVKDVNGIKIGMICYTYNTGVDEKGNVSLNSIPLTAETSGLINTFSYSKLDSFYKKLGEELTAMRAEGAEATMIYIHWGDEYKLQANSTQKKMAQALCDLGIDVIVGNHAHVPQPVELLTNSKDEAKKTLCLYSTGNSISNIRRGETFPAETEDGMLFSVTFAKYSDGTVLVESAEVLPTWVNRYTQSGQTFYKIMTMHTSDSHNWRESMGLTHDMLKVCQESYDRTMAIVGAGLEQANQYYAQNQIAVEKQLGVTK
jgi:poly-gamma-glutamate synthesis protein (capsule biosynthesis protein)